VTLNESDCRLTSTGTDVIGDDGHATDWTPCPRDLVVDDRQLRALRSGRPPITVVVVVRLDVDDRLAVHRLLLHLERLDEDDSVADHHHLLLLERLDEDDTNQIASDHLEQTLNSDQPNQDRCRRSCRARLSVAASASTTTSISP